MTKTAIVKEVTGIKPWNGPNGTVWFHRIILDNDEEGEIGKRQENGIKVGDTLTYTSEQGQYGLKFKEVRENNFNGGGRGNGGGSKSTSAFALSYAKDICVANIQVAGKPLEMTPELAQRVTKVAEIFQGWLKQHE